MTKEELSPEEANKQAQERALEQQKQGNVDPAEEAKSGNKHAKEGAHKEK